MRRPVAVQQDVAGFQIAVNDADAVGVLQGIQHREQGGEELQITAAAKAAEIFPFDVPHREEVVPLGVVKIQPAHDVGMNQPAGIPPFALEQLDVGR